MLQLLCIGHRCRDRCVRDRRDLHATSLAPVQHNTRVAHLFMPSNATELGWWLVVSVLAGTGEEITWRAVQTGLLAAATGNYPTAVVLSALSFGAAHAVQGWRSSAVIVVFALGFQTLVWLTGSLYIAMAVHIVYDITAGISYGRLARQLGYAPAGMAATA
jgi:membrane protease YdiL (CAAX protease family)